MPFNISNMPDGDLTNNSSSLNESTQPSFGAKLGLLAVMITAIGDILAVVSAGLVIDEGIEDAKNDELEKKTQEQQFIKMQNQIDSLQKEIRLLQRGKKGQ
ncbi:MAG TPA: hypothetical protein VK190_06590 [Pseudoneobacillus sp.]|nr:hypothetical protein [Pseudoneobacillus sp.]